MDATESAAFENRHTKCPTTKTLQRLAASSKRIMSNILVASVLTGSLKGEDVFIFRISMIPTDIPFQFKTFTINKFIWRFNLHQQSFG